MHPHEQLPSKLCAYEPCYLRCGRSTPEKTFEEWLEGYGAEIVAWWIKNGETAGTDFSRVYTDAQGTRLNFFPDYIVEFTDGPLGLFETKELEEAFFESAETCDVNERNGVSA